MAIQKNIYSLTGVVICSLAALSVFMWWYSNLTGLDMLDYMDRIRPVEGRPEMLKTIYIIPLVVSILGFLAALLFLFFPREKVWGLHAVIGLFILFSMTSFFIFRFVPESLGWNMKLYSGPSIGAVIAAASGVLMISIGRFREQGDDSRGSIGGWTVLGVLFSISIAYVALFISSIMAIWIPDELWILDWIDYNGIDVLEQILRNGNISAHLKDVLFLSKAVIGILAILAAIIFVTKTKTDIGSFANKIIGWIIVTMSVSAIIDLGPHADLFEFVPYLMAGLFIVLCAGKDREKNVSS